MFIFIIYHGFFSEFSSSLSEISKLISPLWNSIPILLSTALNTVNRPAKAKISATASNTELSIIPSGGRINEATRSISDMPYRIINPAFLIVQSSIIDWVFVYINKKHSL